MAFLGGQLLSGRRSLGANLGADLGSALQGLAQHKVQQKQVQELERVGFPKELASIYHNLDPKVQQDIWKQVSLQNIGQQQPQQQQPMQPTFTPEQVDYIKSIQNPMDRQRVAQQFQQQNQQQNPSQFNPQEQVTPNQQVGQAAAQQQVAQQLGGQQNNSIFKERGNDTDAIRQEANDIKRAKYEFDKQQSIEKTFEPIKEQFRTEYKTAAALKPILKHFREVSKELAESGEEWGPVAESALTSLAEKSGLDLRSLAGDSKAEQLRKISAQIVNIGSAGLGARSTNLRVRNLQAATPSLSQTPEGRDLIAREMEIIQEAGQVGLKETAKIRKENGGNLPLDFDEIVLPRVEAKQDEILNKLYKNPLHEVKEESSQYQTSKSAIEEAKKQGAKLFEITNHKTGEIEKYRRTLGGTYVRSK